MKKHSFVSTFSNFVFYNLIFLLLQLAYSLFRSASFIHALPLPSYVYLVLFAAVLLQLCLYLLLSLFQSFLIWGVSAHNAKDKHYDRWLLLIYFASILFILSLNCYFFPLSAFSRVLVTSSSPLVIKIIMILSGLFLLALTVLSLIFLLLLKPLRLALIFAIGTLVYICTLPNTIIHFANSSKPNIIIIGVDSLSPEQVNQQHTPFINDYLQHSVHFVNTVSPLARTYSAWASILTGLYAQHHHARENLISLKVINSKASFAWTLQDLGYQTVFATDDRRFNNMDGEFGFQKIIGPAVGVNDVLLGSFYDFPLSNFLINYRISHWLLPYNYINRAGHFSYYPGTFNQELQHSINQLHPTQPLFLAVHFTLTHWPYAWAASSPAQVKDEYSIDEREGLYYAALRNADDQVKQLMVYLNNTGALTNSLVILLSDHGEVLYKKGSRKTDPALYQGKGKSILADYFQRKTATELQKSVGHGTDLLSPSQFFCVLGIKIFQNNIPVTKPGIIKERVVLMDLAPTIYDYLHLKVRYHFDGISLMNALLTHHSGIKDRSIMLESGLLPNISLSPEKAVEYGQLLFRINPQTDQLELRPDRWPLIDAMKLYGILQNEWLLALYPDDNQYITVILNLKTGEWTDENDSFALHSPRQKMLEELLKFYQPELATYPKTPAAFKEFDSDPN